MPQNPSSPIIRVEEIFLDIGRKLCSIIGWREAIGHVYVLLYMQEKALSLDEIAVMAHLSKSNVWGIIQQLLRLGAVRKVWLSDNRKDYYEAERDVDLILTRGIIPLLQSKVSFLSSYLDNAKRELELVKGGLEDPEENDFQRHEDILAEIINQKDKLESFLNLLGGLK